MKQYAKVRESGESGITAFETGRDFIRIMFVSGPTYRYSYDRPGNFHVEKMKKLALSGQGLATYINKHVRGQL